MTVKVQGLINFHNPFFQDAMNSYIKRVEDEVVRLRGTGSGEAMAAVLLACKSIREHRDRLDGGNRIVAGLALCSALSEKRLADTVLDMAERFE